MFRCTECGIGSIRPIYRRNSDPKYRCNHCNYRHWPYQYFAEYIPIWPNSATKRALADSVEAAVPTLVDSAEELNIALKRLGDAANKAAKGDMQKLRKVLRASRSWLDRFLDWVFGRL